MLSWIVAAAAGIAIALLLYGWREPRRLPRLLPAAILRALALTLLFALLFDAPVGRRRALRPIVALDVSASWLRGGDTARWQRARASAGRLARGDTLWLFGDSLRAGVVPAVPGDPATRSAPVAERGLAAGRPVVLVTDGELDDAASLGALPGGSRFDVSAQPARVDAAVVSLDAPRAAVSGDTVEIAVTVRAGTAPVPAGTVALSISGRRTADGAAPPPRALATMPVAPLAAGGERKQTVRVPLTAPDGPAMLSAVLAIPGDTERRNDTLSVSVDVVRAAGAVLVSTSPDLDARFMVPVLRGALSLPTRAYFEVAPGSWRLEGSLARVPESEVRAALRDAPIAILHGDTAAFGPPRAATTGALVLFAPPREGEEWYVVGVPASPLSAALSGIPLDSLPPLELADVAPRGEWEGLLASRPRTSERQAVLGGTERPRRVVVVGASGFWRWQFRGGVSADAFTALWGGIFDWASAERADRRGAMPADAIVRAGERVRWRRGSATDSVVVAVLRARGGAAGSSAPARVDSVPLRFGAGGIFAESDPLPAGAYDVELPGGAALLVVNASRELLPRAPTVRAGEVTGRAVIGDRPRLRDRGWAFVLVILVLCAEWLLRRRLGLR